MDINQPLDQAQIADAVNRQKVGTQRQRNEMMRLGTSDPNSFAMQNQKQLQEAQQPTEFWGAGRKIAEDQNPDLEAANFINPLVKLGGVYNYYGDTDSSTAKWGTPYGKMDIGGGKYNILGSQGQTLGTGYKSLQDSISEMYRSANAPTAVSKWKDFSGQFGQDLYSDQYSTDESYNQRYDRVLDAKKLEAAGYRLNPNYQAGYMDESYGLHASTGGTQYQKLFNGYDWKGSDYDTLEQANAARDVTAGSYYTGNTIRDWENLGQLLTQGNITGDIPNRIGGQGGNQIADQISGLNTLYGSTPLIFKDKLYGYKNALGDTTPIQTSWNFGDSNKGKWANEYNQYWGNAGLGREYSNPDWWSQNTKGLGGGNYFISADKAAENPGWLNKDYYNSQESHQSIPNGRIKDTSVGVAIGNLVGGYFGVPVGSLVSAAQNYNDGNTKQGNAALGSALISYGVGQVMPTIDTGYGDLANMAANGAMSNATTSALSSFLQDDGNFGKSALLGALSGAAGGLVGGLTSDFGDTISGAAKGFTKGALSSLGSKNMLESALSSGAGGALGGLFNEVGDVTDKKTRSNNTQAGQQMVKLAQLFKDKNGTRKTTGR